MTGVLTSNQLLAPILSIPFFSINPKPETRNALTALLLLREFMSSSDLLPMKAPNVKSCWRVDCFLSDRKGKYGRSRLEKMLECSVLPFRMQIPQTLIMLNCWMNGYYQNLQKIQEALLIKTTTLYIQTLNLNKLNVYYLRLFSIRCYGFGFY